MNVGGQAWVHLTCQNTKHISIGFKCFFGFKCLVYCEHAHVQDFARIYIYTHHVTL